MMTFALDQRAALIRRILRAGGMAAIEVCLAVMLSISCWGQAESKHGLCKIVVRDRVSNEPVPLVELRTTSELRYVTDNAGVIAFDAPDLMNREVWFGVHGHGYQVPADGFGIRGVRLIPRPNISLTVKVDRTIVAERLGRLTGCGLLAESQKLGEFLEVKDAPLVGCDSVQMTIHRGKAFWNWGDTNVAKYPLGNFHMTGAYSDLLLFASLQRPIRPAYEYILRPDGAPKPMAPIEGKGPTWLSGYISIKDQAGGVHLVACYRKIKQPMDTYEMGLCEWNEQEQEFRVVERLWREAEGRSPPTTVPEGHAVRWTDPDGQPWILFGNPFPKVRIREVYDAWRDPSRWEAIDPPLDLAGGEANERVKPHTGSIAWNPYRHRWVAVFMQHFGKPSAFGELWYAESTSPTGPWSRAVKILSHDNYTFYNPRVLGEFFEESSSTLLFEGTYTQSFANKPFPTPRYDYNQILYRLDLDDPRLLPARVVE